MARGFGSVKMVLAPTTEVVALYVQTFIIQVGVLGLESLFSGNKVCLKLAMILASDK